VLIPLDDPVCLLDSNRVESQHNDLLLTCHGYWLTVILSLLMRTSAACIVATVIVFGALYSQSYVETA